MKEVAKKIRQVIKKEFGFSSKQVSVRVKNSAIIVSLKCKEAIKKMDEIENKVSKFESFETDIATGCILSGGNIFVSVRVDYDIETELIKQSKADIEKLIESLKNKNNIIQEFKGAEVIYFENCKPDEFGIKKGESFERCCEYSFIRKMAFL